MKKQVVEIHYEKDIKENSIAIYRDKKWTVIDKSIFLSKVFKDISDVKFQVKEEEYARETEIERLQREIEEIKMTLKFILGEDTDEEKQ